jgi:transcriptional regulator
VYIAPVDAGLDEEEWRSFVAAQGFGHLAASGLGRDVPVVVPTQFILDGDEVLLHLVARNPLFAAIAEQPRVLLSVAGDWAFVPSTWKAIGGEDPRLGIPTTYYGAVQLVGTARTVDDADEVAGILRRQLARLEPGVDVADPAEAHRERLRTIRGLRVAVEQVRAKFKYGGNVDADHRRAVVEKLRVRGGPGDLAAAGHALRRLARQTGRSPGASAGPFSASSPRGRA